MARPVIDHPLEMYVRHDRNMVATRLYCHLQAASMAYKHVDGLAVYMTTGQPQPHDISTIIEWMLNESFNSAYQRMCTTRAIKHPYYCNMQSCSLCFTFPRRNHGAQDAEGPGVARCPARGSRFHQTYCATNWRADVPVG